MNEEKPILDQRECKINFLGYVLKPVASGGLIRCSASQPILLNTWYMTFGEAFAKSHKMRLEIAKLQLENPELEVWHSGIIELKTAKTELAILKAKISTAKRMFTKTFNAIEKYKAAQSKLLIPNFEDPKFIKTSEKLDRYRTELKELAEQLNNNENA